MGKPETGHQEKPAAGALDDLTQRERQILELVAAGLSNKEIAGQIYLSEKTIKYHMTKIMQKLHVRNRVAAAMRLQRNTGRP